MKLKIVLTTLIIFLSCPLTVWAQKPNIHIIATGGTIAGSGKSAVNTNYNAAQLTINTLLDAVPQVKDIANITGEQLVNIGSQDMTDDVWLNLAKRINKLLNTTNCDGIVITHGTDTMEETAFFLNLTVKSNKPVVLVGAMRASTALSADGPLNLYNAVVTAASKKSMNHGVMIVMNGKIIDAHNALKTNTINPSAFKSLNSGAIGYVFNGDVYFSLKSTKKHTINSDFDVTNINSLPKVGIVYGYSNIDADMLNPLLNNNYKGIVYAGVGNGNIHKNVFPILVKAVKQGIQVVRSSRVASGPTTLDAEVDDAKYHFIASQELNPQKARILLMLSLSKTNKWKQIQNYFNNY